MRRAIRTLAWLLVPALALGVALVAASAFALGPLDGVVIQLDGAPTTLAPFHVGHWLVAVGAVTLALIVALLIVLLVLPIALLVPLLIAALVLVGALIAVAGVAALALSPLLVCVGVVWLVWRLVGRSDRRGSRARGGSATIAG